MKLTPYPGYETHVMANIGNEQIPMEEIQTAIAKREPAPGTIMEDRFIPGPEAGQQLRLKFIRPAGLPSPAPVVMDVHGGGWVSGSPEIDDARNLAIAEGTPCVAVSVDYRLATSECCYPKPLEDVICAWHWIRDNAAEIDVDPEKMGLMGTSAGGNLSAGLQLWLRDHNEPAPKLAALNCPALSRKKTLSKCQFGMLGDKDASFAQTVEHIYCPANGQLEPYYAFPGNCHDLTGLGATCVIVAEYDPLRDEGLDFALRLLQSEVPCEIMCAPRVTHGFCTVAHPLSNYVHAGVCASFRREFGMEITEF